MGGRDLLALSDAEMRAVRGSEIAMIFQEPMTSLNPVLTVGEQIAEVLRRHRSMGRAAAAVESLRLLCTGRIALRDAVVEFDGAPLQAPLQLAAKRLPA